MQTRQREACCAVLAAGMMLWSLRGSGAGLIEQACETSVYPLSTPTTRFEDHGDGTVTDKQSNLMWMRCAAGQTWSQGNCRGDPVPLTWQSAQAEAQSINQRGSFFYSDWRLPQIPELAGIAERQCRNPRINLAIFPQTPAAAFWTATSRRSTTEAFAFVLSFGADGVHYDSKEEKHLVRLVRTGP